MAIENQWNFNFVPIPYNIVLIKLYNIEFK